MSDKDQTGKKTEQDRELAKKVAERVWQLWREHLRRELDRRGKR
jgi:hypothetical protein